MPGLIVFILGTAVIFYFSWSSLGRPGSHGFYRFFAWEFILILVCLDLSAWFHDPFAWHQLISWFLLVLSIPVLVLGVTTLKKSGRAQTSFEATTQLVEVGIYGYIRHPMYASLLYLAWGLFFKSLSWQNTFLVVLASLALWLTARADETECLAKFGKLYAGYMRRTKRFIPFLL